MESLPGVLTGTLRTSLCQALLMPFPLCVRKIVSCKHVEVKDCTRLNMHLAFIRVDGEAQLAFILSDVVSGKYQED
jgi:hypothetical protein